MKEEQRGKRQALVGLDIEQVYTGVLSFEMIKSYSPHTNEGPFVI